MIVDRSHLGWGIGSAAVTLVAAGAYVAISNRAPQGPSGGSAAGLVFGILAALAMVVAGLLAVRKRFPTVRVGSAKAWLKAHLWFGLMSVPLTLFHAGFRWGGTLELVLLIVTGIVIASGVFGLVLQHFLPRLLTERAPQETFVDQVPGLCRRFQAEGDLLVAEKCGRLDVDPAAIREAALEIALEYGKFPRGKKDDKFPEYLASVYTRCELPEEAPAAAKPGATAAAKRPKAAVAEPPPRAAELREFYLAQVRPFLDPSVGRSAAGPLGQDLPAQKIFAMRAAQLPNELLQPLARLQQICDERRMFLAQLAIHRWLHYWLLVHVPLAAALFALLAVHIFMALRVVP